ncbi:kit ligand [Oryzias latipes]|uniref:kit ligand n=1 Tax=Oryzias latipes TaxID=8090 RepID=UPI0005CB9441|nr:kit ligand [Oryzias latipes]
MKKSKSWIRVCVRFLLLITLGVPSCTFGSFQITDDISKLSVLKQNIPRDYNISVRYIPKELAGMCWVKLNIFFMEESLNELAKKFGNVSSNKNDIKIFIDMLQYMRLPLGNLEPLMYDFECHFRNEQWQTEQYFDYVKDLLKAAEDNISDDCDPPPCPTSLPTETFSTYSICTGCSPRTATYYGTPEKLLQSLPILFIPLLALVFLLVWKLQSKRNEEISQQYPLDGLFTRTEGTQPPQDEASETLNITETV